ncbi:MAG: methyltransferase domain-containing protein [Candidatus Bipolaricaulia bacterium]
MERVVAKLIDNYVGELKKRGTLESEPVERAFRRVERHRLLEWFYLEDEKGEFEYAGKRWSKRAFDPQNPEPELLRIIYSDEALLTRLDPPSSTSQPALVAQMLELLELKPAMNVLEIGAGTGYNAALMQEIVGKKGRITTIDIQEDVADQTRRLLQAAGYDKIEVIAKDGALGHSENAPYDRIIATVGCPDISFRWAEQLRDNGFMLIPLQHGCEGFNPLVRIWKEDSKLLGKFTSISGFMSIRGELGVEQRMSFAKQESLHRREPAVKYPLFGSLKELNKLRGKGRWDEILAFPLFIAIADERACWLGLYDEEKGAIEIEVREAKLALYGDEILYYDLKKLYDRWEELGRPGLADWRLAFFSRDQAPEIPEAKRTWAIERKFSKEIIKLAPSRR